VGGRRDVTVPTCSTGMFNAANCKYYKFAYFYPYDVAGGKGDKCRNSLSGLPQSKDRTINPSYRPHFVPPMNGLRGNTAKIGKEHLQQSEIKHGEGRYQRRLPAAGFGKKTRREKNNDWTIVAKETAGSVGCWGKKIKRRRKALDRAIGTLEKIDRSGTSTKAQR